MRIHPPSSPAASARLAAALARCHTLSVEIDNLGKKPFAADLLRGLPIGHLTVLGLLQSFNPVADCAQLQSLHTTDTVSDHSLSAMAKLKNLRSVCLNGPFDTLAPLAACNRLTWASLRSLRLNDFRDGGSLKRLKWLGISLGSAATLNGIEQLTHLQYIELFRIGKLTDFGFLGRCPSLRHIQLQSFSRPFVLPSLRRLKKLERVDLIDAHGLSSLKPVADCCSLKELYVGPSFASTSGGGTNLKASAFRCFRGHPSLKSIGGMNRALVLQAAGMPPDSPFMSLFSKWARH